MASGDTALWLHNKLGSTDDLWSGKTICSQLTQNKLQSIQACFHSLQPHVKVKLMLSFLHIPRRSVDQWKGDLEQILNMATHDSDQWVSMVGEILQTYPSTGTLNLELDNISTFAEILTDLNKVVKKCSNTRMLPLECQFLNKTALVNATGPLPKSVNHFTLKRKSKSAILRAELLQKSSEAANNKKSNTPNSVPYKVRSFAKRMDDDTPLKGLPGRTTPSGGFRSPSSKMNSNPLSSTPLSGNRANSIKKEGGIKYLEIAALPLGAKEAKRRRKIQEMEEMEQKKKDKEAAAAAAAASTTPSYAPDYAAGLVSPAPSKTTVISSTALNSSSSLSTPSGLKTPTLNTPTASYAPPSTTPRLQTPTSLFSPSSVSSTTQNARDNLQQQLQQQLGQSQVRTQQQLTSQVNGQSTAPSLQNPSQPTAVQNSQPSAVGQPQTAAPKKGLSLTREQMLEAQEMFKTSNKVTRPEKALILGFMAGSRENPCPQQGHVLSIRLSENEEPVAQTDGTSKNMIADTFFQMNYETGEWKRIKKYRECRES